MPLQRVAVAFFFYRFIRRNATRWRFRLFRSRCLLSVCLSAALCIVAKRCKIGIYCVWKSNRNVGMRFRLVPFSTPRSTLTPQIGGRIGGSHNLPLKLRSNGDRDYSKVRSKVNQAIDQSQARVPWLTSWFTVTRCRKGRTSDCIKILENRGRTFDW